MHAYIGNERRRDLENLSPAAWEMLQDAETHGDPFRSGGKFATWRSLRLRGLMLNTQLTRRGREAIQCVEWREALAKQ